MGDLALDRGHGEALLPSAAMANRPQAGSKHFRAIVCKYWLRNSCVLGDRCEFLHRNDRDKLPICDEYKKYGFCKDYPDCPFKHEVENISECNMYRLGFCVYGDKCRFKHIKYPGPPPEPGAFEASKPKQFRKKGDP